jgi:hypothetical protein
MADIVINIPQARMSRKLLKELEKDIRALVRMRLAREMLLSEWDKKLSRSALTDSDALVLGSKANKAAFKRLKEQGLA